MHSSSLLVLQQGSQSLLLAIDKTQISARVVTRVNSKHVAVTCVNAIWGAYNVLEGAPILHS